MAHKLRYAVEYGRQTVAPDKEGLARLVEEALREFGGTVLAGAVSIKFHESEPFEVFCEEEDLKLVRAAFVLYGSHGNVRLRIREA